VVPTAAAPCLSLPSLASDAANLPWNMRSSALGLAGRGCGQATGARTGAGLFSPTAGGRVCVQRPPSLSHGRELVGDTTIGRRSPRVPLHQPTKKAWVVSIAESASFFMLQVYVSGVLEVSKQCCKLFHFDAAKVDHDVVDVVFECCGCYFLMLRNSSSCCVCNMTCCCDDFFCHGILRVLQCFDMTATVF
jgi:hypothetical protein